jgi:hypothetical protein
VGSDAAYNIAKLPRDRRHSFLHDASAKITPRILGDPWAGHPEDVAVAKSDPKERFRIRIVLDAGDAPTGQYSRNVTFSTQSGHKSAECKQQAKRESQRPD